MALQRSPATQTAPLQLHTPVAHLSFFPVPQSVSPVHAQRLEAHAFKPCARQLLEHEPQLAFDGGTSQPSSGVGGDVLVQLAAPGLQNGRHCPAWHCRDITL